MSLRACMLPLLFACPACTWWSSQDHVLISSEPLGAHVAVDGEDSGKTTPCRLLLGGTLGHDHVVELTKKGYRPTRRRIYQYPEGYTSKWIDGVYDPVLPPLPLFWTVGDFVFPFAVRSALMPAEIHVRLDREDAPLLGFDLPPERRSTPADR